MATMASDGDNRDGCFGQSETDARGQGTCRLLADVDAVGFDDQIAQAVDRSVGLDDDEFAFRRAPLLRRFSNSRTNLKSHLPVG